MKVIEQIYEFTPPDGDPGEPIKVIGLQDYSPDQPRKVAVWEITVPGRYRSRLPNGLECHSYAEVCGTLARCFFDGDETKVREHMVQWYAGQRRSMWALNRRRGAGGR